MSPRFNVFRNRGTNNIRHRSLLDARYSLQRLGLVSGKADRHCFGWLHKKMMHHGRPLVKRKGIVVSWCHFQGGIMSDIADDQGSNREERNLEKFEAKQAHELEDFEARQRRELEEFERQEQRELEEFEREEAKTFVIKIDRTEYRVHERQLTGLQLRNLPTSPIGPDRDLFEVVPGGSDIKIADNAEVKMRDGLRFFTAPAQINPGNTQ